MPTFEQIAGQFFLESAAILYDDLARRAACDDAEEALVQRRALAAKRLIDLIDRHGDQRWETHRESLCG